MAVSHGVNVQCSSAAVVVAGPEGVATNRVRPTAVGIERVRVILEQIAFDQEAGDLVVEVQGLHPVAAPPTLLCVLGALGGVPWVVQRVHSREAAVSDLVPAKCPVTFRVDHASI